MCEVIEGLYKGLDRLIGSSSDYYKLVEEHFLINKSFNTNISLLNQTLIEAQGAINEKDFILADFNNYNEERSTFEESKIKILKYYKDSTTCLKAELTSLKAELDNERQKNQALLKQNDSLASEIKSLKKRFVKVSPSFNKFIELICQNCKQMFKESENFNWSCRYHKCEYSDNVYWCCGNSVKGSIGCVIGKHQCTEELDDTKVVIKSNFCSSCRSKGHECKNCPKDPNVKGFIDYEEELDRVKKSKKNKRKTVRINELDLDLNVLNKFADISSDLGSSRSDNSVKDEFKDLKELKKSSVKS